MPEGRNGKVGVGVEGTESNRKHGTTNATEIQDYKKSSKLPGRELSDHDRHDSHCCPNYTKT